MRSTQVARQSDLQKHLAEGKGAHAILATVNLGILPVIIVDTTTLIVDSVNHRVGVGTAAPGYLLDVAGIVNATTGYYVAGTKVLGAQGATIASPGDPGAPTPTSGGWGFSSLAIMNAYTTAVSLMRTNYNLILARLRAHGIINT